MVIYNGNSSETNKCSICGCKTGSYYAYEYVDGICITLPMCHTCMDKRSDRFYENVKTIMDARLKQIKKDIKIEKEISF